MDKPYDIEGNVYRDDVDIACNPRGGGTQFNPRCVKRVLLHMPSGETHELRATDTIQSAASFEGTFYAIDSSNIIYVQDTGNSIFRAKMPDGSYDFDGTAQATLVTKTETEITMSFIRAPMRTATGRIRSAGTFRCRSGSLHRHRPEHRPTRSPGLSGRIRSHTRFIGNS
ncbi:MAG: hypothetical protein M9893_06980 [Pyrinomonadaceae bacterium]|nr:hypothetical protein [Pyrinomonadaceae bacterium]